MPKRNTCDSFLVLYVSGVEDTAARVPTAIDVPTNDDLPDVSGCNFGPDLT